MSAELNGKVSEDSDRELAEALERRIGGATDHVRLAQLASELAHALALGHLTAAGASNLAKAIGRQGRNVSERDLGYLTALADVIGAAGAAMEDETERHSVRLEIARRASLRKIVLVLHRRPRTPNELATAARMGTAGRNDGRITRHLQRLEDLGLVERAPVSAVDKRVRPRQLTGLGHRVALELNDRTSSTLSRTASWLRDSGDIASRVISILNLVRTSPSIATRELAACAGPRSEHNLAFVQGVVESAEKVGMVGVSKDGQCEWGVARPSLVAFLERCRSKPDLLRRVFEVVPSNSFLSTNHVQSWQMALATCKLPFDIATPSAVEHAILDGDEVSAVLFDDDTVADSFRRSTASRGAPQIFVVDLSSSGEDIHDVKQLNAA